LNIEIDYAGIPEKIFENCNDLENLIESEFFNNLYELSKEDIINKLKILIRNYIKNLLGFKPQVFIHIFISKKY